VKRVRFFFDFMVLQLNSGAKLPDIDRKASGFFGDNQTFSVVSRLEGLESREHTADFCADAIQDVPAMTLHAGERSPWLLTFEVRPPDAFALITATTGAIYPLAVSSSTDWPDLDRLLACGERFEETGRWFFPGSRDSGVAAFKLVGGSSGLDEGQGTYFSFT
jgi:hypothetical protein